MVIGKYSIHLLLLQYCTLYKYYDSFRYKDNKTFLIVMLLAMWDAVYHLNVILHFPCYRSTPAGLIIDKLSIANYTLSLFNNI